MLEFVSNVPQPKGLDKEKLLKQRATYISSVLEGAQFLSGTKSYVVAVLVAHYVNRKTQEFAFSFADVEARDPWGKAIPIGKLSAITEDLDLLNELIEQYSNGEVCAVNRYIDFEDVMNKKCRGGFEIESSGVMFMHFNQFQFDMISSIPSLNEIERLTKELTVWIS
jgi:hypothetical protein